MRIQRKKFRSSNAVLTCVVTASLERSSTIVDFGATDADPTNANAVTAAASATSVNRDATRERRTELGTGSAARSASRTRDRKSTRLNSSHSQISYAVFCLKKKQTY